jgi:hypothetical protein
MKMLDAQRRRETAKLLQFLELMKATVGYGRNTRQQSASVRCHERNSLDPKKDNFFKLKVQSLCVFKRYKRLG